jgi:DNA repair exonuclease SbcCD ATPase subunit
MAAIEITKVRAKHSFAFEDVTFEFSKGIHAITGINGASKSSLFMVLSQCLYNKNPKGIAVDDVSNDVTGEPFEIEVSLTLDGEPFRFVNSKLRNKVEIFRGDSDISIAPKGKPAALKMIAEMLGSDFNNFVDLGYRHPKNILELIEETGDSKRKKFIEGILDYSLLDDKLVAAKAKVKDHQRELVSLNSSVATLRAAITEPRLVADVVCTNQLETQIAEVDELLPKETKKLHEVQAKLEMVEYDMELAVKSVEAEALIASSNFHIDLKVAARTHVCKDSCQEAYDEVTAKLAVLGQRIDKGTHVKRQLKLSTPTEPETVCTRCGQSLGAEEALAVFNTDMAKWVKDLDDATKLLEELTEEHHELVPSQRELSLELKSFDAVDKLLATIARAELELTDSTPASITERAESTATMCNAYQKGVDQLTDERKQLERDLANAREHNTIQRVANDYNQESAANNIKLANQIEELEIKITVTEVQLSCAQEWVIHYGPTGIRVHKMSEFLQLLNGTMLKYADIISGGRIKCMFYVTEAGKIEFVVSDEDKKKPFANWSDGEKERVKMACLFSVIEILELKGECSLNIMFLDEVFGSLDEEGREGLFKVLAKLRNDGKCIYTIAHTPVIQAAMYDTTYKAVKEDGISTYEETHEEPDNELPLF